MFNEPGRKLKTFAVILFVLDMVAVLIAAIAVGNASFRGFAFWRFAGVLVGGFVVSYIAALFLYAFGELVDSAEISANLNRKTSYELDSIGKALKKLADAVPAAPVQTNAAPARANTPPVKTYTAPVQPGAAPGAQASKEPPARPAQEAKPKPTVWDPKGKTLVEHLQYASKFTTPDGMQRYLQSVASIPDAALSPEDKRVLRNLCNTPPQNLRAAIISTLQRNGAAP